MYELDMFVNLTPNEIVVMDTSVDVALRIHPSGNIARCAVKTVEVDVVGYVPLFAQEVGEVVGLPPPRENTIYIVSAMVRMSVPNRTDVASPGDLVCDASGKPIGCFGLIVNR